MTTKTHSANRKLITALVVGVLGCAASVTLAAGPAQAGTIGGAQNAQAATAQPAGAAGKSVLVRRLKQGNYEVPDFSCGYRHVQFKNGVARDHGEVIAIERIVLADLNRDGKEDAALHLSFSLGGRKLFNHLIVVVQEKGKLVQAADYSLEDFEEVKGLQVSRKGVISVDSVVATYEDANSDPSKHKVTKLRLVSDKELGNKLLASEWEVEPGTNKMRPYQDLSPYLFDVQDKISSHWNLDRDRTDATDRVVVGFTIDDQGQVSKVHLDRSSENATTDEAALQAVQAAAPFPPLPEGVAQGLDVQFEFQYSVVCKSERSI
ncbi:MAG: TonB family protein [Candidatus Obscuribacterales bacterium]